MHAHTHGHARSMHTTNNNNNNNQNNKEIEWHAHFIIGVEANVTHSKSIHFVFDVD